jgi:hypothetical protein
MCQMLCQSESRIWGAIPRFDVIMSSSQGTNIASGSSIMSGVPFLYCGGYLCGVHNCKRSYAYTYLYLRWDFVLQ